MIFFIGLFIWSIPIPDHGPDSGPRPQQISQRRCYAHKALFHMGDARSLAPNSDPHACKQFRFLRLGGRDASEGVGGGFLNFVNSFAFFRSKPVPFLKIGAFAMQSDISDDPRSRSPRGSLSATTLELPGRGEGRIQDEWPPRIPADYAVRPNAWLTQRRALPVAAPAA